MRVHSCTHIHASIHIPTPIHTYIYINPPLHNYINILIKTHTHHAKTPHINNSHLHTHACMQKNPPMYTPINNTPCKQNMYIITCLPYINKYANLGAICGAPTEALAEASGAAEDVIG